MARFTMPPADVQIIDPKTGMFTSDGYDLFKALERLRLSDLADVSTTSPADTEVLIWNDTDKLWEPGAN